MKKLTKLVNNLKVGGDLISSNEIVCDASRVAFWREHKIPEKNIKKATNISKKVRVTKINYRSNGHRVVGFIIEPRRVTSKTPCIIWNRGGCLNFDAWNLFKLITQLGDVASSGYIIIASQYSGNSGSEGKDEYGGEEINDVLILPRILAKHRFADIHNISMVGASRGGLMTYLALARVQWIKAAVVVGGLADLQRNQSLRPEMKKYTKGYLAEAKRSYVNGQLFIGPINFATKLLCLSCTGPPMIE